MCQARSDARWWMQISIISVQRAGKKTPESSSCVHDESFAPLLRSRTVPKVDSAGEIEKKSWSSFFLLLFFPDDVGCNKYASTLVQMKLVWRISHTRVGHSRRLNRWRGWLTTWAKTDMSSPTPAAAASLMVCRHRHWCCCCCTSNLQYFNHYSSFFFLSSFFLSLLYLLHFFLVSQICRLCSSLSIVRSFFFLFGCCRKRPFQRNSRISMDDY